MVFLALCICQSLFHSVFQLFIRHGAHLRMLQGISVVVGGTQFLRKEGRKKRGRGLGIKFYSVFQISEKSSAVAQAHGRTA